jgi:signal transduction histidine kinase
VGTGLGLWVVRRIVEDHDGVITVHSNGLGTGHGTSFEISLPAANPHRTSEASA